MAPDGNDWPWLTQAYDWSLAISRCAHETDEQAESVFFNALSWLRTSTIAAERTWLARIRERREGYSPILLDAALFQRLAYKASDIAARKEEERGTDITEDRLVFRYLQHLVLHCMRDNRMSSGWIAIGISQLVYRYTGAEVDQLMLPIVRKQWSEGDRKRDKRKLMAALESRFGGRLQRVDAKDGVGAHFEPLDDQSSYEQLLLAWLERFIPWGTPHGLEANWDGKDQPKALRPRVPPTRIDHNRIGLNEYHVFICPECFGILVRTCGYLSPVRIDAVTNDDST
jgi:hypothetical protein